MTLLVESGSMQCRTAEDRAARESATMKLFERRERSTDEAERQVLLDEIVALNLEIARGIARRFRNRGPEAEDLEQVACLGLLKAVLGYRPGTGTPFIGYAVPTIRGEVKRYFRDCAWTVRIPRRLQEVQQLIGTKTPVLAQELGREPSSAELAERLGLETGEVDQALAAYGCFSTLSLDRTEAAAGPSLAEVVADEEDATLQQLEAVDMLRPVLEQLSDRDRRILELRFVAGWTQAEIGADIGVSQMQVSRLLGQILTGLRQRLAPLPAAA